MWFDWCLPNACRHQHRCEKQRPREKKRRSPGRGIAILRIDGAGTESLIRGLFLPAGKVHPADAPRRTILGTWIEPDETVTLKWDKKTNESGCKWYFKAVFEDGDESAAKKFDFCEEDLELEF